MKELQTEQIFSIFTERCTSCHLCEKNCSLLKNAGITPAEFSRKLLTSGLTEELIAAAQECSLCGRCSQDCPQNLNPAELMQAARDHLVGANEIDVSPYRPMLVDEEHHFFSLFRDTWDVDYKDLSRDHCDTLFFPGCTLSSFAPELTRSAWTWLREQGLDVGFSDQCCGLPLKNIGLSNRSEAHLTKLRNNLVARGVKQIITACPNCFYHLRNNFDEIQVDSLYQLMDTAGVQISGYEQLTVHDSCPDRFEGEIGRSMRSLLPIGEITELPHHGTKTRCCGAGGIVSMVAPQISNERAEQRLSEFHQSGMKYCVSACMGCVKRLTAAKTKTPPDAVNSKQGQATSPSVVHILELIFNQPIDHAKLDQQLNMMWQQELGEKNLKLLSEPTPVLRDEPVSLSKE